MYKSEHMVLFQRSNGEANIPFGTSLHSQDVGVSINRTLGFCGEVQKKEAIIMYMAVIAMVIIDILISEGRVVAIFWNFDLIGGRILITFVCPGPFWMTGDIMNKSLDKAGLASTALSNRLL
ncbi:hypothetical protein F4782DRAFT_519982 [Xylaria castorea]|nr:hypothetical protein F4782DRAFT_519982 [Xylaria castorea]